MQTLMLAEAVPAVLLSWWKMLLFFVPFTAWAYLVSSVLEKDARYFFLNHRMWNGIYLGAAIAALVVVLAIPLFWVGLPIALVLLAAPVLVYWKVRNASVPEGKQFYLTSGALQKRLEQRRAERATGAAAIRFVDAKGTDRPVPTKESPMYATHVAAEDLLGPALEARASRVDLNVTTNGGVITQTIDGVRYKRETIAAEQAMKLIDYIKDVAGLDVEDRRKRQRGMFRVHGPQGDVETTIIVAGSSTGQTMRLEFERAARLIRGIDNLGLLPSQLELLQTLTEIHERHGIVLIAAPPDNGLRTTGYSFTARHDAYTANIKTLEREIEARIDGVDHAEFDPTKTESDFAMQLQSILRRDPDVVMISEIQDEHTAQITAEPGAQGPLIYVPLRVGSVAEAVRMWVKYVGDVEKAVKPLKFVTNQRLLRTLCTNCRQPYQPSAEQLRKLNIPSGKVKQLYRKSGQVQIKNKIESCPVCQGTGYLGQTGAFELMPVDSEARKILRQGDLKAAMAHARRNKMVYLQEAALAKVMSGETSIEEVIRVTAPQKAKKSPSEQDAVPAA